MAKAVLSAEADLGGDSQEPSDRYVDEDWLLRWKESASEVPAEELRPLRGCVPAGEIESPGTLRFASFIVGALLILGMSEPATAQQGTIVTGPALGAIAFVNVNLIRMTSEQVEPGQTVIVSGSRIAAIGSAPDVRVPEGVTVIDGSGRYLVPGLTDAHVHLTTDMPWAPTRPNFGDAPLYLAHGVTTVINLRGSPTQLEWRQRINAGELLGPTIYTSGEFINEPRVNTVDEVVQEIAAQRRAGYDVIKFHEVWTPGVGFTTTTGLSRAAYLAMNDTARAAAIPLVGHAPVNLGLETLLLAQQPLAHVGMLSNIYFLPLSSNRAWLLVTAVAFLALTIIVVTNGLAAVVRRWRATGPLPSRRFSRARRVGFFTWLVGLLAGVSAALFFPGGPLFESVILRLAFTSVVVVLAVASVMMMRWTAAMWRDTGTSIGARWQATVAAIASLAVVSAGLIFWVPTAWRSSNGGIERLAERVYDAGITVQSTLVAYEALGGPGRLRLTEDPTITYLRGDTRAIWSQIAQRTSPPGYRYTDFVKKVVGALHRVGVPLMAGTDAMGLALVAPGSSLHYELELLTESGLTPYEAIRAATVVPARFLGMEHEFGSMATGTRADLLLIEGNPLEDVARLSRPIGVMTRGRWFMREQLQEMLTRLTQE